MQEKIIFLELFQPFAQYRNPFTFYYAQTFPLPPKSTIIGMLQNAVDDWYGKNEEYTENSETKNRWWNLKVSVHGGFESVFWNYQQLIKGELTFTSDGIWINKHDKNPGGNIWLPLYSKGLAAQRSPIYQQELFNGHLYIFIKAKDEEQIKLLEKIKEALEKPRKILYLGRSEDVIFIKDVRFIKPLKSDEVEEDIKLKYPTYILYKGFPIKQQKYPVYSIPTRVEFKNNGKNVSHKSEITKKTERLVRFQSVIYTGSDYSIILKEPIKIDIFKINDNLKFSIIKGYGWL